MKYPVVKVIRVSSPTPVDVVVSGGAQIRWDLIRASKGWPDLTEAPSLWAGYVAYESMRTKAMLDRTLTFDDFVDDIISVEFQKDKVEVDPTQPGVSEGSAGS